MSNKIIAIIALGFLISAGGTIVFLTTKHSIKNTPYKQYISKTPETSFPSLTLDAIFSNDHTWIATLSAEKIRVITATGDIIPARSVNYHVMKFNNPLWPYEKVIPILKSKKTDITFVNLETPLIKECPITVDGMVFCGDAKNIAGLEAIGVTIANIANNHVGNHGIDGVAETKTLLENATIAVTGINGPVYKDIRGMRFAFLGYNDITKPQPGITNANDTIIKKEIAEAKKRADIVVVTYHWGVEYRDQPDDDQKRLGHVSIDAGADLVIGNHPHWIQPIEFYKGKLITYAHG
ncbi:MAG: CapA family protein, partial [Candidatus Levybacteria bacterium]|nr:CapA family protein [Candidatus Levybacteria bacterium]